MPTVRAPRKSTGCVDAQLQDFEDDLYNYMVFQLVVQTNTNYWEELDQISSENRIGMDAAIDTALLDLSARYSDIPAVMVILDQARVLFKNVVWAAMNVPFPVNTQLHIERVCANLMDVYNTVIYAPLRTEMIMTNHNIQVIQRTWRRCITDPSHPACRRRLEYEFAELEAQRV